jgi:FkbM family methyltransferase
MMSLTGLKRAVRSSMRSGADLLGRTRFGRVLFEQAIGSSLARSRRVRHRDVELTFCVPNGLNHFRVQTFASKEPETLAWIDTLPEGSVLWDIGANIGLYSCYAARARKCRVIAFEPSVFNLELLARNVFLNSLTDRVTIVPLPLFESVAEGALNMTSMEWGGALSTFGADYGFDGKVLDKVFEFRTVGLPMDEFVVRLGLPAPDFIKMDVDGIEHLILRGGSNVLSRVRGISLEINEAFEAQASESSRLLNAAGLRFVAKAHSDMIENNVNHNRIFNQVWSR